MAERVLQLLGPSTGGIRRHVGALAAALEARGWEVTVAGPAGRDGRDPRRGRGRMSWWRSRPALQPLGLIRAVWTLRGASAAR